MILCLDSGNTRLKWAIADQRNLSWLASGAVPQSDLPALLGALREHPAPTCVAGCNVASALQAHSIEVLLGMPVAWLTPSAASCGVRNGYARAEQLGADRWAGLVAARSLHAGPALVVSAGTATTVDMLSAAGEFVGGVILPGVDLMRQALAQNTANLPWADAAYMPFPDNTGSAIVGGVLEAQAGAITRLFARLPGESDKMCFISGGAADRITPLLEMPLTRVDDLALRGVLAMTLDKL